MYRDIGFALRNLITDELNPFVLGAVFVTTWLLFVSGAMLGTALQLWANERERAGRRGSNYYDEERGAASTSGGRAQLWLGYAGTVIAALIGLIGTLLAGRLPLRVPEPSLASNPVVGAEQASKKRSRQVSRQPRQ